MKSSSEYRGNRNDLFIIGDMSRRAFLKAGIGLATIAAGLETISGCVAEKYKAQELISPARVEPKRLIIPKLPYHKIQSSKEGCLVGLHKYTIGEDPITLSKMKNLNAKVKDFSEFREILIREKSIESMAKERTISNIRYYEEHLGIKPFTFVLLDRPKLYLRFPEAESIELARRGIVPYVNACIGNHVIQGHELELGKIISGQYDVYIREFAEGALAFGKAYGGFFFTTMEEANGYWYSWSGKSQNYISAWRHIWEIFDELGTNRYATWVWETFCPYGSSRINNPEYYYPGDKYVDWIGINAYSVARNPSMDKSLYALMHETYRQMQKNHPQKPIMQSEFARTNQYEQQWWIQDAYSNLKNDFPAIKAAIYYDNTWTLTGDHTLSRGGLTALKDIFKDSYWITAK